MAVSPIGSRRGPRATDGAIAALPSDSSADGIFLGIDFGTSGCRAVAINAGGELLAQAQTPYPRRKYTAPK